MRAKHSTSSSKSTASRKNGLSKGGSSGQTNVFTATKLLKTWRFAPDAIGMFSGPKDLSLRKGLSA